MKTGIKLICLGLLITTGTASLAQCPQTAKPGQHVIQAGETLYKLAKIYQVSLGDLCSWNHLTIYDTLKMCQVIQVQNPVEPRPKSSATTTYTPAGTNETWVPATYSHKQPTTVQTTKSGSVGVRQQGGKHVVQPGETVAYLADLYGYTERRFRQINVLSAGSEVTPGSVLLTSDCTCPPIWTDGVNWTSYSETTSTGKAPEEVKPVTHSNISSKPVQAESTPASSTLELGIGTAGMTKAELDMVAEINLLRSNPAGYVAFVEKYQRESMLPASAATAAELIAELKATPKLSTLTPSACLREAAKWHAESQRPKGDIDHQGVDGSWPWDRALRYCQGMKDGNENIVGGPSSVRNAVIVLLLDEGIPNRGHRRNLLNKDWTQVACYGAGTVGSMPNCYVQMFGY